LVHYTGAARGAPIAAPDITGSVMKRYVLFLIGPIASVMMYLFIIATERDYLKMVVQFLTGFKDHQADRLVFPAAILLFFVITQLLLNNRRDTIELEKARIYRAMLRSIHHVLNNFLNNMILFKIAAEKTPGFPEDVLSLFDEIIADAEAQIESLGGVERIDPRTIEESVVPKKNNSADMD
jgi:hypothetical protein